jgi:hypothetical protein
MKNKTPAPEPATVSVSFIDNPLAPDVYADDASGFMLHNGVVKITFVSARANHAAGPGAVNRVVVGRLVTFIAGAQALSVALYNFLKNHGLAAASAEPLKAN